MFPFRVYTAIALALVPVSGARVAPADAQTFEGHVRDGVSKSPLSDANVTLLHPDGTPARAPVITDRDGAFTIVVPGPGEYYLRAEGFSYQTVVDGVFAFSAPHGRMSVDIFLLPKPLEVEGIRVAVEMAQIRRHLRTVGFYERAGAGFGHFIGPEEVERRHAQSISDLVRRVPGVRAMRGIVLFTRRDDRMLEDENGTPLHACEPNVWVDGVQMTKALPSKWETPSYRVERDDYGQGLDEYMNVLDVAAIEVYTRASSTPLQWGGLNGSCGTIVIWTRRARR